MAKLILSLGVLLTSSTTWAGALPYEWYSCTAQGISANGTSLKFKSGGMSEREASESALYQCNETAGTKSCEVISCSWQTVRPKP